MAPNPSPQPSCTGFSHAPRAESGRDHTPGDRFSALATATAQDARIVTELRVSRPVRVLRRQ